MARKKTKKKRNKTFNFWRLLLVLMAICFWMSWLYIFFGIKPAIWAHLYYVPFFGSLFFAILFTISLVTRSKSAIFFIPLGVVSILILRLFHFREWYYSVLILATVFTLIYFFTASEENDTVQDESLIDQSSKQ